jgi:hypothetical protein
LKHQKDFVNQLPDSDIILESLIKKLAQELDYVD